MRERPRSIGRPLGQQGSIVGLSVKSVRLSVKSSPGGRDLVPGICQYAVSYSMRRTCSATVVHSVLVVLGVHGSCVWFPEIALLSGKFVIARL